MKPAPTPADPTAACERCPQNRLAGLRRLGINVGRCDHVVALAGNPNTGKSTLFNGLTGLRQHTGNWPGKTVTRSEGGFAFQDKRFEVIDLPGTYSLLASNAEEEVARDFLLFGQPDVTVVVVDAGRLERNLNLVLQVLEITDRVVVCLNLIDEARSHGVEVEADQLGRDLGVPVVATVARSGQGVDRLLEAVYQVATGQARVIPRRWQSEPNALQPALDKITTALHAAYPGLANSRWIALRLLSGDERITEALRTGTLAQLGAPASLEARLSQEIGEEGMTAQKGPDHPEAQAVLQLARSWRETLGDHWHEEVVESLFAEAGRLASRSVVRRPPRSAARWNRVVDRWVTSRLWGFPLMLLLFTTVFWLTISGANVPSGWLSWLLIDQLYPQLQHVATGVGLPWWLKGVLVDGMYLATAWVVSVMLPPMAIFFPLFTLLEDLGYLPRVAFNLDSFFQRAGAHGKQSLAMMMGYGCNAAGVIATRIIDSPRERLIAILTNNFALCNGRWPTQILLASIFLGVLVPAAWAGLLSAAAVVGVALLGVGLTFLVAWVLSRTILRGEVSTFSLELPPYRPPRIWQSLYTSLIDRTLFVLWRAVVFALPAGAVIWLISNVSVAGLPVAEHLVSWLGPLGFWMGLNGIILLAYVVAIPANEIVIPTILMLTVLTTGASGAGTDAGVLFELESEKGLRSLLHSGGWTVLTAVNLMLFSLVHNPCSTTLYTIYKETGSWKWTALAALIPLGMGVVLTVAVAQAWRWLAGLGLG